MNMDLKIVTKEPRKYFNTILFFNSFFPIICYLPVITLYDTGFPREKDIALFLFFFKFLISFFNDCFFFSVHLLLFSSVAIVSAFIGDIFKANETLWKQIFFYRLHNITDHNM